MAYYCFGDLLHLASFAGFTLLLDEGGGRFFGMLLFRLKVNGDVEILPPGAGPSPDTFTR